MEQFNTIPTSGNWADIAGILDANFLRCWTALVQSQSLIGLDGSNYKGMYTSASALPDDMTEAGWALVGTSLSALQLYVFNDGATDWALFSNETYNFTSWTEFQTQLDALSTQVATIGLKIGDLTELETEEKTNLVGAINEVNGKTSEGLNGNIGSLVDGKKITNTGAVTSSTTATNRTLVADVADYVGQMVSVSGLLFARSGSTTYCWWAIHDANGGVLLKSEYSNTSAIQRGDVIPIPSGAKTLYVQGDTTTIPCAVVDGSYAEIKEQVQSLREYVYSNENIIEIPDIELKKFISGSSGIWTALNNTDTASIAYSAVKGDKFIVTANENNRAYCYLLTQVTTLTGIPSYMEGTGKFIIPAGETYIIEAPADGYLVAMTTFYTADINGYKPSFICKASKDVQSAEKSVKAFPLVGSSLKNTSGTPNNLKAYTVGYAHTPKLIRLRGSIKILTNVSGFIHWYDSTKTFMSYSAISYNTEQYNSSASYFALTLNTASGTVILPDEVKIEGIWKGDDDVFRPIPADEGFVNLAFVVDVPKNPTYSTSASELTEQFTRTSNHAMLHLPPSYDEEGIPTKLIIYLHGAAERYDDSSTRFGTNVRYSPEWSAAGFAQLDVDMIPDSYGKYTLASTAGSGDDAVCVFTAYQYVIQHYNIARDGVYLFGRSRGGQAVLECLAQYDAIKMPVIAALSNAGANTTLIYSLFTTTMNNEKWQFFANAMGLPTSGRPTISTTSKRLVEIANVVTFLRTNIDVWWKKACVALRLVNTNNTEYKTPLQIFNMIVDSYNNDNALTYSNWVRSLVLESPVPLRFDWCNGDTTQDWTATTPYNYSVCVKDAFVDNSPKCIYRYWPSIPSGSDAHYHEKYNFYNGNYTLPNGAVVTNPSMAQTEWLLWAMGLDPRFNGSNSI